MASTAPIIPPSLKIGEYATLILSFGLTTILVSLRVYTKTRLLKSMKLEDWFSLLSYLAFLGWLGLAVVIGENGGDAIYKAYISIIESAMYCPICVLVKVSILLQYITIFVVNRRSVFHYVIHVILWTNVVFYTLILFLVIFQCTPRAKSWNASLPGHCSNQHQLSIASAVINVVSDFVILVLPFRIIWKLQMSWERKWKILAVFAIGFVACVSSVVRLVYSVQLNLVSDHNVASHEQQLATDKDGLWAIAELALGIIAGCMPVIPRFFKQPFFTRLASGSWPGFSARSSSTNSSRTLVAPRIFGKRGSRKSPKASFKNSKNSESTTESGGMSFRGIETQHLTRASIDLPEPYVPIPVPAYRMDSLSPLVDKPLPDPPETVNRHREREWQEISRVEKAEPARETLRDELERKHESY